MFPLPSPVAALKVYACARFSGTTLRGAQATRFALRHADRQIDHKRRSINGA